MSVIELTEISKSVNGKLILSPTTLSIKKGDFFALVGGPSSGKSVLLDIMMNFVSPSSGTASIFGMDCNKKSSRIRKSVGYCAKDPDFCHDMRIADLLVMCSKMRRVKNRALTKELCDIFELNAAMRLSKIGLSDRKIVGLIIAMMHSPEVILLDSPFYGLDKVSKYKLQKVLSDLNKNGTTIFMTTEDNTVAQEICSRVAAIHQGTMLDINEQDKLINSDTRRIGIKTDDDISALLVLFNIKEVFTKKGYISFLYKKDINDLIQALTSYRIHDLQISLPDLSEVLSDYYENELEQEQSSDILTYNETDTPVKNEVTDVDATAFTDTTKIVDDNADNNNVEDKLVIDNLYEEISVSKDSTANEKPISLQSEIAEEITIDIPSTESIATENEIIANDISSENVIIEERSEDEQDTTEDSVIEDVTIEQHSEDEQDTTEDSVIEDVTIEQHSEDEQDTTEDSVIEDVTIEEHSEDEQDTTEDSVIENEMPADDLSDISEAVNNSVNNVIDSNYDNDILRRLQEEDMNEQISPNEEVNEVATNNKKNINNDTADNNAYKKKNKRKKHRK